MSRKAAKPDLSGPFIEITKDDRGPRRQRIECLTNAVQLQAARLAQKAQMHADDTQVRQVYGDSTARFQSGQGVAVDLAGDQVRSGEHGDAVPSKADVIVGHGKRAQAGAGLDHVAWQGRGARAQTKIGLLQDHHICVERRYGRQHPQRIAAKIGAQAGTNVVTGKPKRCEFCHDPYIGMKTRY